MNSGMVEITIGKMKLRVETGDEGLLIDGNPFPIDIVRIRENYYSIIHDNKSFTGEVLKVDRKARTLLIRIDGHRYEVSVKDKFDLLLEKMGMGMNNANRANTVKAPMPGLIVDMKIREGDVVKQHDPLLVLEAMKMENVIKSPGDGIVKTIHVGKGESVEKNQILVEF